MTVLTMSRNLTCTFLSLLFIASVIAKPAPENTFRFDNKANPLSNNNIINNEIAEIQDKIGDLRSRKKENLFVDNLNNLKLFYLQTKLDLKLKESR